MSLTEHWAEFKFKVLVPTERREEFLKVLYDTAFSIPEVEQTGLLTWNIHGEWKGDYLEKAIIPFLDDLDNSMWQYEYECETGFIRIHYGKLEGCGIMPNGCWNEIEVGEEMMA